MKEKYICEICGEEYEFRGQAVACKMSHERETRIEELSKDKKIDKKTGRIIE